MKQLPKIIDLFSGCGGLALGFKKAGFDIVAGIELMQEAVDTISYNLSWRYGKDESHLCGDITKIDAKIFEDKFGEEGCIVIGGPPCQAYSSAGKGKLRSLGEHRVNTNDARGYLYQDFLRFAFDLKAKAVIMENVPESTKFGDKNIPEIVCEELTQNGYNAYWTILCSADYGTPQIRERVIVLATKNTENIPLPEPTNANHTGELTQRAKQFSSFEKCKYFRRPNTPGMTLPKWNTVEDAFSDLPELFTDPNATYVSTPLNVEKKYKSEPSSEYQKIMREWFEENPESVTGNAFRKNTRDFPIFDKMKQGDNYVDASAIADELFAKKALELGICAGTKEYETLKRQMVPIYNRKTFTDKWRRLEMSKPSHTVVAHLSVDTYSHIHPTEPRGISVREAARLQSFPDGFMFPCSMGDAFKQIGNAVPPLLSYGIAKAVRKSFIE